MVIQTVIKDLVVKELSGTDKDKSYVLGFPTGTICGVPTLVPERIKAYVLNPEFDHESSFYHGELTVVLAHPDWPNDFSAHICVWGLCVKVTGESGETIETISVYFKVTGNQTGLQRDMLLNAVV